MSELASQTYNHDQDVHALDFTRSAQQRFSALQLEYVYVDRGQRAHITGIVTTSVRGVVGRGSLAAAHTSRPVICRIAIVQEWQAFPRSAAYETARAMMAGYAPTQRYSANGILFQYRTKYTDHGVTRQEISNLISK